MGYFGRCVFIKKKSHPQNACLLLRRQPRRGRYPFCPLPLKRVKGHKSPTPYSLSVSHQILRENLKIKPNRAYKLNDDEMLGSPVMRCTITVTVELYGV